MQLRKRPEKLALTGVYDLSTGCSHSTSALVKTVDTSQCCLTLTAHILSQVMCDLLLQRASTVKQLPQIKGLKLAVPQFDQPGRIDLLIGGEHLGKLISQ